MKRCYQYLYINLYNEIYYSIFIQERGPVKAQKPFDLKNSSRSNLKVCNVRFLIYLLKLPSITLSRVIAAAILLFQFVLQSSFVVVIVKNEIPVAVLEL